MPWSCASALLITILGFSDQPVEVLPESNSCIHDGIRVEIIHKDLRLIDIAQVDTASETALLVVSPDGDTKTYQVPRDGSPLRLKLEERDLLRVTGAERAPGRSFDPLVLCEPGPAASQTPGWALGAVWYNVFPERFDNANPRNDQGWPHATDLDWAQDWFEVSADEFEATANRAIAHPQRYADDGERRRPPLRDSVFERRFGGDLQGVERRLDHIRDLGATVIWFCPIFEATSLHKYEAADHRHIDPHLAHPGAPEQSRPDFTTDANAWVWTPADRYFIDGFLPAAKQHGLRVVLDGVWNHVGTAHPTFQHVLSHGRSSTYADWYHVRTDARGRVNSWQAWDRRNGGLPEFRQLDGDLVPGPREHVFDVTSRWMDPDGDGDPSDGIDGWRLDVANEIGMRFWSAWREHVRSINDQAVLVGELWFDGRDYFEGRAFDAQMNYPLAFVLTAWLGRDPSFSTADLVESLDRVYAHADATNLAQVNLLGSHDTPRIVSMLQNPGREYDRGAGMGASAFDRAEPDREIYERLVLAYRVLTFLPGSPMVYAGDELGVWGADDPENRKPLPWPGDTALTSRIADSLLLRQDATIGETLRLGAARWWEADGLLWIERGLGDTRVRLAANPSGTEVRLNSGVVPALSSRTEIWDAGSWIAFDPAR